MRGEADRSKENKGIDANVEFKRMVRAAAVRWYGYILQRKVTS